MSDDSKKSDETTEPKAEEGAEAKAEPKVDAESQPTVSARRPKSDPAPAEEKAEKKAEKEEPKAAAKKPAKDSDEAKSEDRDDDKPAAPVRRPGQPAVARPSAGGEARRARASGESWGVVGVALLALGIGNVALAGVTVRYDATREERFTLSKKGTAHLLSTLQKPLKITVFAPTGLANIDNFVRDVKDLLNEYVRYGNGKITYEILKPDELEGEAKTKVEAKAQEAGLKKQILGAPAGKTENQATISQGYLGMLLEYGGEKEKLDEGDGFSDRNPMGLEFMISSKIRELRDREDKITHRIGFLQGHKEKGFQELSQVFGRYFPYYKFEAVDLAKGEKAVDESLDGLIVTSPGEEISTKEQRRIDQFLMRGKAVAVIANTVHIKDADPQMTVTFNGFGVDKLLSGYGIDYKNELIVDTAHFWTPVLMGPQGLGIQFDPYPFVWVAQPADKNSSYDASFPPLFRLSQLALPYPTEITVDKARAGGDAVTINNVVKTTPNIVIVSGTSMGVSPTKQPTGITGTKQEKRSATLGVSLEGPIKSAFPGPGDGVDGVPAQATGKARLFVMSTSDYFSDPFHEAGKSPFGGQIPGMDPNMGADEDLMRISGSYRQLRILSLLVAKQTCDWISQETDLLAVGAKLLAEPELDYHTDPAPVPSGEENFQSDSYKKKRQQWLDRINSTKKQTQYFNILFAPVVLGLFGLFRWWNRNNQRASVKI